MASLGDGILRDEDWDEKNLRSDSECTPYWTTVASVRRCRRIFARIASAVWPKRVPSTQKLRSTAYLDGLRGFAALLVYWHHHELWAHFISNQTPIFENSFGYVGNHHFAIFPGIRNFFCGGHYAVATFFVTSGYVLSTKPLSLTHSGELASLSENISSAMFRRWFRLFLPIIATIAIYATSWHVFDIWVSGVERRGSWVDEMWAFYLELKNFSFVYKEGGNPWLSYSLHLWSIPIEFKGSMVIYATAMALSRASRTARLWCEAALAFYFMYIVDGWYCAMFMAGMLLCDLDLLAKSSDLPRFFSRLEPYRTFLLYHLLVISLFLGGVPSENRDIDQLSRNYGWYILSYLKPQAVFDYKWFYLFWAAASIVICAGRIGWLRRFFETSFCQHLGRISYGLYLVHGPVLWTLGDRLYVATGWHTDEHLQHIGHWADKLLLPRSGPLGLEISFLVPHMMLLPLTLFLAELVTRAIDTPSVSFAAWLYKKTIAPPSMRQVNS